MAKVKKSKKKNFKLRRRIRKTFGCLFMISALIVTAIPVTPTEAGPGAAGGSGWTEDGNFWRESQETAIPNIQQKDDAGNDIQIYRNETEDFSFVYVDENGKSGTGSRKDKFAIIVDYARDKGLADSRLIIPATMDAYMRISDSNSTGENYAAANKDGNPLYYKLINKSSTVSQSILDPEIVGLDEDGAVVYADGDEGEDSGEASGTEGFQRYAPCTQSTKSTWSPNGEDGELYYFVDKSGKSVTPASQDLENEGTKTENGWKTENGYWKRAQQFDDTDRIALAEVKYIGKQCVNPETGKLMPSTAARSVFGGTGEGNVAGNIVTLTFAKGTNGLSPVIGIGKYAFYGCTNINSITLDNGLNTLGNYAFANCRNLNTVNLDYNTNLTVLGACTFQNCESLKSFPLPTLTTTIGDFCFANCYSLESIEMTNSSDGSELRYGLTSIGYKAFLNCSSLKELLLPSSYDGADDVGGAFVFHLSTVSGCTSLERIRTESQVLRFVTDAPGNAFGEYETVDGRTVYLGGYPGNGRVDGTYTFAEFKREVGDDFYFEGPGYRGSTEEKTPVHNIANVNYICFRYFNQDRYEIVEDGAGDEPEEVGLVFEVNSANELQKFHVENRDTGETLINTRVPEITMPNKVGPKKIEHIIEGSFNDKCYIEKITIPETVITIGSNAFKGSHNLKHILFDNAAGLTDIGSGAFATQLANSAKHTCEEEDIAEIPFLSFTGDIVNSQTGENTEPFKYAMRSTSKINEGTQPLTYVMYYSGMPTNLAVQYNPDTGMSELKYFPTKEDAEKGFKLDENPNYEGAYTPFTENSGPYRFPYMNLRWQEQATQSVITNGSGSEDQRNIMNGIENIVIPVGVNSIKKGLFSELKEDGYYVDKDGFPSVSGNVPGEKAPGGDVKTLTVQSVAKIEPYTFARMSSLTNVYLNGAQSIGNYAFDRCPNLQTAQVSADTTELGLRPFSGCTNLSDLQFPGNEYFAVDNGIIYGISQDENKTKTKIIECLESRGSVIGSIMAGPNEFETVNEIADEAFMDCDMIASVDLSASSVTRIPERCFAEMDKLAMVTLPGTTRSIGKGSFWNTPGLAQVKIPYSAINIAPDAFAEVDVEEAVWEYGSPHDREKGRVALVVNENSYAVDYVLDYPYLEINFDNSLRGLFAIALRDGLTEKVYDIKYVPEGDNLELTILDIPDHTAEGYQFERWSPDPESINPITKDNLEVTAMYLPIGATTYLVRFFDIEGKEMEEYTQQVEAGKSAKSPAKSEMEVDGKVFTGWDRDFSEITGPLDVHPIYIDRMEGKFYVSFYTDMDLATMIGKVQEVNAGESAIEPAHPTKEGYVFSRWSSDGWQNVTRDWEIFAVYTEDNGGGGNDIPTGPFNVSFYTDSDMATRIGEVQVVNGGESAVEPEHPTKDGYTFSRWSTDEWKSVTRNLDVYAVYTDNNGGGSGGGDNGGDGGDGDGGGSSSDSSVSGNENSTKYKVTVNGGSGSGEYTPGTIVPINAYARADGTVFDKWTSSSNGVGFVDQTAISTNFTMPSNDVTIDANYKQGGSSSSSSVSGNSRNANRNSTTTVDVSKSGISNTDLASANVNGSSDNFVIRITDDASATAAVIAALEAKYGDISDIAYLPMDISLYAADGATKITDVSGITVDLTLPLPDDLIQYAGNNKAAGVVNGRLEDLDTRFTTIDGIPCVQFTATHFSPYTIYVDTAHLSAGTIDATPKTGDPIHPKWFLAMGLACISIVLFCKKDRQPKLKRA